MRMMVTVRSPIRRMVQFKFQGQKVTGYFAYERLPNICLHWHNVALDSIMLNLSPEYDFKSEPTYNLWIQATLERSWVIFRLEEALENLANVQEDAISKEEAQIKETNHILSLVNEMQSPNCPP